MIFKLLFLECKQIIKEDLHSIVTPIKVECLQELLQLSGYDQNKSSFLIQGFTEGFDIDYTSPTERQSRSENIPLTIGTPLDLWNKIIKKVDTGRVAGPFKNFIQSQIGLVPKVGGNDFPFVFQL